MCVFYHQFLQGVFRLPTYLLHGSVTKAIVARVKQLWLQFEWFEEHAILLPVCNRFRDLSRNYHYLAEETLLTAEIIPYDFLYRFHVMQAYTLVKHDTKFFPAERRCKDVLKTPVRAEKIASKLVPPGLACTRQQYGCLRERKVGKHQLCQSPWEGSGQRKPKVAAHSVFWYCLSGISHIFNVLCFSTFHHQNKI
jgi:hypothetical protein